MRQAVLMSEERERLLTVKDIAREWGLNPLTIQRALKSGRVKGAIKFSSRGGWRVRRADWEAYITSKYAMPAEVDESDRKSE